MVKTRHFHGKIFYFKFDFWQKSVKLLRWPKNEHSCISILLILLDQSFISLDQTLVHKFGPVTFPLYISIFVYIHNFIGPNIVYKFGPGLYTGILIFYLPWTKHLIKLYIKVSFEVFKVNLYKKSLLWCKEKYFYSKI